MQEILLLSQRTADVSYGHEYEISIGGQQPGERSRALTGRETEILTVRKEGNEENVEY